MDLTQLYPWYLETCPFQTTKDSPQVVSTFSSGGGSTMGYKLAGFSMQGAVDIDPKMMKTYSRNFDTPNKLVMGVGDVVGERPELVEEWQNIDILDGSPPCTLFSRARPGEVSDSWNVPKKFREGQAVQILDKLFFDYLDLVDEVRPKTFIAENVAGMLQGHSRGYVKAVVEVSKGIGYDVQVIRTRAGDHGVPQVRNRIFFLGIREDLHDRLGNSLLPSLKPTGRVLPREALTVGGFLEPCPGKATCIRDHLVPRSRSMREWLLHTGRKGGKQLYGSNFSVFPDKLAGAITAAGNYYSSVCPSWISAAEFFRLSSFPDDYMLSSPGSKSEAQYVTGMSVPPLLMRAVAAHVCKHWLERLD